MQSMGLGPASVVVSFDSTAITATVLKTPPLPRHFNVVFVSRALMVANLTPRVPDRVHNEARYLFDYDMGAQGPLVEHQRRPDFSRLERPEGNVLEISRVSGALKKPAKQTTSFWFMPATDTENANNVALINQGLGHSASIEKRLDRQEAEWLDYEPWLRAAGCPAFTVSS
ncbi:hypothetical protein BDQ17DRAFT_1425238 [Cyathus striatus]|nr:hypothetical protein BDQ17DRAFT_1425238 [Cyathus striatus]